VTRKKGVDDQAVQNLRTRHVTAKRCGVLSKCGKLTCLDHNTSRPDGQPGHDESDVSEVEYLGSVWQRKCPQLRRRPQDVNEAPAVA
jgi:hypothetical protein